MKPFPVCQSMMRLAQDAAVGGNSRMADEIVGGLRRACVGCPRAGEECQVAMMGVYMKAPEVEATAQRVRRCVDDLNQAAKTFRRLGWQIDVKLDKSGYMDPPKVFLSGVRRVADQAHGNA